MPALTTIKLRRGTAAAWTAANPTLAAGEPGLETDTGKWKWGDGATAWNSLAYANGAGGVTGFATPAVALGTAASAGAASTTIRSDATIVAFDATAPTTQALGDAAATGSAAAAARRDHKHAMPAAAVTTSGLTQATGKLLGRSAAGTGAVEEITVGTGLSLSAGSLTATGGGGSLTIEEVDGSPSVAATKLVFPNGTLGVVGTVATYTPAGGGGGLSAYSNSIPRMTGASSPSGTASASENYATTPPWQAMAAPGSYNGWITNGSALPQWIQYQYAAAKTALAYGFRAWWADNYPSRTPTAWTFAGSNNGSTWTTLDTRSGFSPNSSAADFVFAIASPASYAYYRMTITANGGNSYTGIGQFLIFTSDATVSAVYVGDYGIVAAA